MNAVAVDVARWGNEVVVGTVHGHPCRMYAQRPRAMAELLLDAQRWADRPFLVQGGRRLSGAPPVHASGRLRMTRRSSVIVRTA